MKKQLLSICALMMLGACANTEESSICEMFGWCYVPEPDVKEIEIDQKDVVVDGYDLAKRGYRYDQADYILSPQVYAIVASRVTNDMLHDAPAIFAEHKNAPLYIAETTQVDRYLPDGPEAAGKASREIIEGSQMFNLVDSRDHADYILESSINNINTPERPLIEYVMTLYDAKGNKIESWSDSLRQVQNDDGSWW